MSGQQLRIQAINPMNVSKISQYSAWNQGTSPQNDAAFIKSGIDKVAHIAMAIGLQPM